MNFKHNAIYQDENSGIKYRCDMGKPLKVGDRETYIPIFKSVGHKPPHNVSMADISDGEVLLKEIKS